CSLYTSTQKPITAAAAMIARKMARKVLEKLISTFSRVSLDVIEQRHETEVHVYLLMAMEKSETGIVGNKVDFVSLVDPEADDILHDTGRGDSGELSELKAVAMKMDRMNVVAGVAHPNAITFALF